MVFEMYYEIRERWKMVGGTEYYFNIRQNLKEVKKFIEEWVEIWIENAEDSDYKFLGFKTDYRTYAVCRVKTSLGTDNFRIKVVRKLGKKENRTALSLFKWNEEVKSG